MIRFKNVSKTYPDKPAVSDISFTIEKGETLVFLGASGSGKTTLMKMINRLIDPSSGSIELDGVNIMEMDLVELRRKIGYAIQYIGLFPHLNVAENIGLALRLLHWDRSEINRKVDELMEMVGLNPEEFRNKRPKELSGGQMQRVGVARALAQDPPILLFDEPFGALDPIIREQLQNEFLELESNIQKTIVFVTHDVAEAIKMADRIAIINEGKLLQIGQPEELLKNPKDPYIEEFFGKHYFQLKLMTKTLQKAPKIKGEVHDLRLSLSNTFMDALDLFALSGKKWISVFEKGTFVGNIEKAKLFQIILEEM